MRVWFFGWCHLTFIAEWVISRWHARQFYQEDEDRDWPNDKLLHSNCGNPSKRVNTDTLSIKYLNLKINVRGSFVFGYVILNNKSEAEQFENQFKNSILNGIVGKLKIYRGTFLKWK